jgi:hypothetical protein
MYITMTFQDSALRANGSIIGTAIFRRLEGVTVKVATHDYKSGVRQYSLCT